MGHMDIWHVQMMHFLSFFEWYFVHVKMCFCSMYNILFHPSHMCLFGAVSWFDKSDLIVNYLPEMFCTWDSQSLSIIFSWVAVMYFVCQSLPIGSICLLLNGQKNDMKIRFDRATKGLTVLWEGKNPHWNIRRIVGLSFRGKLWCHLVRISSWQGFLLRYGALYINLYFIYIW